ncbi:MAG: preprotein translocase subunit SecE [Thermodesulfobacteriota bacterium]
MTKEERTKKHGAEEEEKKASFQLSRINEFAAEVKAEFGKIVWPAKKQTMLSTVVVVVLVMLMSLYLGAVDLVLGKIIGLILR